MATSPQRWPSWATAVRQRWQAWPAAQKWRTLTVAAGVVAVGAVALRIATAPHWTPVYTNVTPASAGAMSRVLKQQAIPYALAAGGTSILVPAADVDQARVVLAEHGLPANHTALLPKPPTFSLGETDTEVAAVQQADLEDTLDTTIASIHGVTAASVLITTPPPTLFGESPNPATASVFVTLAPNATLSAAQVSGIQHLVAAAVNGLTPNHVAVINQNGYWLSHPSAPGSSTGSATTAATQQLAATTAVERSLTTQVLDVLDPIFGPGNVVAQVHATLNFVSRDTHTVQYLRGVPTAQQVKTSQSTGTPVKTTAGAGTASNTPTYPTTTTVATATTSKSSNTITHYAVGQTTQTVTDPAGSVTGVTVAVEINQRLSAAAVRQVQALVQHTVGLSTKQAAQVVVTTLPFNTQAAQAADRAEAAALAAAQRHQRRVEEMAAGAGVLLIGLIIVLAWRRRRPAMPVAPPPVAAPADEPAESPAMMTDDPQQRIRAIADGNPDILAKVLETLVEGGS